MQEINLMDEDEFLAQLQDIEFDENSFLSSSISSDSSGFSDLNQQNQNLKVKNRNNKNQVKYGKDYINKGSDEYLDMRKRNNDAIKKCRAKKQEEIKNLSFKLDILKAQNDDLLNNQLKSLVNELYVVKEIFTKMHSKDGKNQMLNDFESEFNNLVNKYHQFNAEND